VTPLSPSRRLYEAVEERNVTYAIRLPANDNLKRKITQLLTTRTGAAMGTVDQTALKALRLEVLRTNEIGRTKRKFRHKSRCAGGPIIIFAMPVGTTKWADWYR
jgi:hypothetical protein